MKGLLGREEINRLKKFLFLGFLIPHDEMEEVFGCDSLPQFQTHKFLWSFARGVNGRGLDFIYISSRPVTDYPSYPRKMIKCGNWRVEMEGGDILIREIPFINFSVLKIFTRFLFSFYYGIKAFRGVRDRSGVIVYSTHVPFMLAGYLISIIYRVDLIAIWTDPPAVSSTHDSLLKGTLRKLEARITSNLMRKVDKVIALTKDLAMDFAPNKPYLIVEGFADVKEANPAPDAQEKRGRNTTKVVYTGTLAVKYGIKNIVDGFLMLEDPSFFLDIYGRGDYEAELLEVCSRYNNIRYKGFLSNEKVLEAQRDADFLINARSPGDEYVKYSFPSKTLEYMLSGTPLITTKLPGIPVEYYDYVILLQGNNPAEICATLRRSAEMSYEDRAGLGARALFFAMSKNYKKQGGLIVEFLRKATGRSSSR